MKHLFDCRVTLYNGSYPSEHWTRVTAATWPTAARKAVLAVLEAQKKRGLTVRNIQSVSVEMKRLPSRRNG
jgi:hypothetical protein